MSLFETLLAGLGKLGSFPPKSPPTPPTPPPPAGKGYEGGDGGGYRGKPYESTGEGDTDLASRVAAFRRQMKEWASSGRLGVPVIVVPGAPEPQFGHCISCGREVPEDRWRCSLCREAVERALGLPPDPPRGGAPA